MVMRKGRHALAMSFGLGILRVQRAAQRLQRVIVRLLQILQRDGKLLRAFGHQMFQVALVSAIFHHQPAMFERAPHAQMQLILFEWLQNVVVSARANGLERDGNIVHRGDHNHRHVGILVAKFGQQFQPVHLGHHDVAQSQVESVFAKSVQGHAPVRTDGAVVALRFQQSRNDFANRLFVIHYQNLFRFHDGLPGVSIIGPAHGPEMPN